MINIRELLEGGSLRSLGRSDEVLSAIKDQKNFDQLFSYLYDADRIVVMRAADAIEKITVEQTEYLAKHKNAILELCKAATNKELKWHLALLLPRLKLRGKEIDGACNMLTEWAKDKSNSKIVRVHSMQGIYDLSRNNGDWAEFFMLLLPELEQENIPSMNARIRHIRKEMKRSQRVL